MIVNIKSAILLTELKLSKRINLLVLIAKLKQLLWLNKIGNILAVKLAILCESNKVSQ